MPEPLKPWPRVLPKLPPALPLYDDYVQGFYAARERWLAEHPSTFAQAVSDLSAAMSVFADVLRLQMNTLAASINALNLHQRPVSSGMDPKLMERAMRDNLVPYRLLRQSQGGN